MEASVSVSSVSFREALAHFASGVTIVTASANGEPAGFTASAFTSVSLAPPLVLVCVRKGASAYKVVTQAEVFGISVLSEPQAWIAQQFARSGVDRFEGVSLRPGSDETVAFIDGALVRLECRRHATHDAGDHTLLLGEVIHAWMDPGRPLVHYARRFGGFASEPP
jgi:flavin reductase (DIM6/NTAB) family NADH-FMN oxidoreductase RutF